MARQRFIWPTIWDDPDLGRLSSDARLLYIGCFSLADDEGRILGDPTYLKTQVFRYASISPAKVRRLRDELQEACSHFQVYEVRGIDYIAFTNWGAFQKPKYPKPSKFPPPPSGEIPGIVPSTVPEMEEGTNEEDDSGTIPQWVGLGWEGKG